MQLNNSHALQVIPFLPQLMLRSEPSAQFMRAEEGQRQSPDQVMGRSTQSA
jgi:hypothetical protein